MTQKKIYGEHVHKAIRSLQEYLNHVPLAHKTVSDLWDVYYGVSRSMVEKAFKDITGYSLRQYLVYNRLQYSKKFLREGMPVKRVAIRMHYQSHSAYCTAFKKFFTITPTAWLKSHKHNGTI